MTHPTWMSLNLMLQKRGCFLFSLNPKIRAGTGAIRATIKDSSSTILAGKELSSDSTGINVQANVKISGVYYLVIDKMPAVPGGSKTNIR